MFSLSTVFAKNTSCINGGSFSPFFLAFRTIRFKAEFSNPSGSSMDRVALAWIEDNLARRQLRTNDTVICPYGVNRNRSLLQLCPCYHLHSLHLIPKNCPSLYKNYIKYWGGKIREVPSSFKRINYLSQAQRLEREHEDYRVLDSYYQYQSLFEDRIHENVVTHLKTIITPIGFDYAQPGINFFAQVNPTMNVIGVRLGDEFLAEPCYDQLKKIIRISEKDASSMALKFRKECGYPIGTHSGAVLAATKAITKDSSFGGEIIRILPDNTEHSRIQKDLHF